MHESIGIAPHRDSPMHTVAAVVDYTYLDQIPRNNHNFRLNYKFGVRPSSVRCDVCFFSQ